MAQKELLFFEWIVIDNCNLQCSYCVNIGEYSHKKASEMRYAPGREVEIARRIVDLSPLAENVAVNFTGGEPLLAKQIPEVLDILNSRSHIHLHLVTNLSLIEKIADRLADFDSILVSLHVSQRPSKEVERLIPCINQAKTQTDLTLSQVDYELQVRDRQLLAQIAAQTGLEIQMQPFIPPWTEAGKLENAKEIRDATFVSSAGKRCAQGYFYYLILPDGTFYYNLWCNEKTREIGNFLAPMADIEEAFASEGMQKCRTSSCGCNYNTFYYEEYRRACDRLGYPERERFGPDYIKPSNAPMPRRLVRKVRGFAKKVRDYLRYSIIQNS